MNSVIKKIVLAIVFFAANLCVAVPADFDADGCVFVSDLAVMAEAWLTDAGGDLDADSETDLADFALFSADWLEGCASFGYPPTAVNVSASGYTYEPVAVTLSGSDDGNPLPPGQLKYIITSYPDDVQLQDPTPGAGLFYERHLPWTLSSWNNVLWVWSETAGSYTVNYKANDSGTAPTGGDSSTATATVTLAAWPNDCLSFDGRGTVTFADNNYYDPTSGWAVHVWFRTRVPRGGLVQKIGDTGPGWQIDVINGRLVAILVNDSGQVTLLTMSQRVDDYVWRRMAVGMYTVDGQLVAVMLINDDSVTEAVAISGSYANAEPVILGRTTRGYQGEVDKLRFFSTFDLSNPFGSFFDLDGRNGTVEAPYNMCIPSTVRFMFSEGSGTTVTDDKASHLTGTLSSLDHVRWQPWNVPFVEVLN